MHSDLMYWILGVTIRQICNETGGLNEKLPIIAVTACRWRKDLTFDRCQPSPSSRAPNTLYGCGIETGDPLHNESLETPPTDHSFRLHHSPKNRLTYALD